MRFNFSMFALRSRRGAADDDVDGEIMTKVQNAARGAAMRESPEPIAQKTDEAPAKVAKRGFTLGLPILRRKSADAADAKFEPKSPENADITEEKPSKPKRGLSLALPSLLRKAERVSESKAEHAPESEDTTVTARKPRAKEVFQSADLNLQEEAEAPKGLSGKVQVFMARLTPAERTPKALAGRPDPFDRLASEVQRSSTR